MSYKQLAKKIKKGYDDLKKNEVYKLYHVTWNKQLGISEITVENNGGFKAIIIGNAANTSDSRGYMYLFYTNEKNVPFPTIKEIERRLQIVAEKKILQEEDVSYHDWEDWEEYGSLEKQREYFSEIITALADKNEPKPRSKRKLKFEWTYGENRVQNFYQADVGKDHLVVFANKWMPETWFGSYNSLLIHNKTKNDRVRKKFGLPKNCHTSELKEDYMLCSYDPEYMMRKVEWCYTHKLLEISQ